MKVSGFLSRLTFYDFKDIVNNLLAQPQAESSNRPLLSTLSIFLDVNK